MKIKKKNRPSTPKAKKEGPQRSIKKGMKSLTPKKKKDGPQRPLIKKATEFLKNVNHFLKEIEKLGKNILHVLFLIFLIAITLAPSTPGSFFVSDPISYNVNIKSNKNSFLIVREQGEQDESALKIYFWYSLLPENIQNKFNESGWTINVVSSEIINKTFGVDSGYVISGVTIHNSKMILMNGDKERYLDDVIHEIGHWIDGYNTNGNPEKFISHSNEFQRIFSEEGKNYTKYGASSEEEFFAEIFKGIILNPEKVQQACPQATAFISAVILQF